MLSSRWTLSMGLLPLLAGLAAFAWGCGIQTNIGAGEDDDTTPPNHTPPGDDDTPPAGDDDDTTPPGDDDTTPTPGDDDSEPTDNCAGDVENCIDGREQGHAFSAIRTAAFSYPQEIQGDDEESPVLIMADYEWTCDALNTRPPTGPRIPATADDDTVVGVANFILGRYDSTIGGVVGATATGTYRVIVSPGGLEDGELVAWASIYFLNNVGTVEVIEDALEGTVEVDEADMSSSVKGSFELELESGNAFTGRFALTLCELAGYDGGAG